MQEAIQLLGLLGLAVISNILGGMYVNVNIKDFKFDWQKLVNGIIKAIIISFMFLSLAYIIEQIPDLESVLGVQPKAMIISAIGIYVAKTGQHLIDIFGLKKDEVKKVEEDIQAKIEEEYMDRYNEILELTNQPKI